ncbi:uncharacterized protein LOC126686701 [Mercurialis annua]|uniref:uncharacterized protein LOC126655644 n=1 Tax=Mercurialis annua TaxID=3986 RepID=UPI00215F377B|nr:uncharacterized protein LOC126655644 [Mercurialis annua]XP_050236847.2 uncharacterized protein LOC126686701 [Mercurialis annua]
MSDTDFDQTLSEFLIQLKNPDIAPKEMEEASDSPVRMSLRKKTIGSKPVAPKIEKKAIKKSKSVQKSVAGKRKANFVVPKRDIKRKRLGTDNLDKNDSFQTFDLLLGPKDRFVGKVGNASQNAVLKHIKSKLSEDQLATFKNSRFGVFLELDKDVLSLRLIHAILLREVHHSNLSELWFHYGSQNMRFSLYEFGLVSGLVCVGDESRFSGHFKDSNFFNKYFGDVSKITRQVIEAKFKEAVWENDEDAVKFAKLYMVQCFLLGHLGTTLVDDRFIHLLDCPDYDDFPWGKYSFQLFVQSTKNKLWTKHNASSQSAFYRLYGFPHAIQFWFYETLVSVPEYLCTLSNAAVYPRLLRWSPKDIKKMQNFDFQVFDDGTEKVSVLSNIVANEFESSQLIVTGLNYQGQVVKRARTSASDSEDKILEVARSACIKFVHELKALIFDNKADYSDVECDVRKRICASVVSFEENQLSDIFDDKSGKADTVEELIYSSDGDSETVNENNSGSSEETVSDDDVSHKVFKESAAILNNENVVPVSESVGGKFDAEVNVEEVKSLSNDNPEIDDCGVEDVAEDVGEAVAEVDSIADDSERNFDVDAFFDSNPSQCTDKFDVVKEAELPDITEEIEDADLVQKRDVIGDAENVNVADDINQAENFNSVEPLEQVDNVNFVEPLEQAENVTAVELMVQDKNINEALDSVATEQSISTDGVPDKEQLSLKEKESDLEV